MWTDSFDSCQGRLAGSYAHGNEHLWPTVSRISWDAEQLNYVKELYSNDTLRGTWAQFSRWKLRTVVTSRRGVRPIWQVFVVPLSPSRRMTGHYLKLGLCRFLSRPTICHYIYIYYSVTYNWLIPRQGDSAKCLAARLMNTEKWFVAP
jgi:hypothetical protein